MFNRLHLIEKSDLRSSKWTDAQDANLIEGNIELRLEKFALTANNVTYAVFGGPPLHYWDFFPSRDPKYGRVPVWGFAKVVASRHPEIHIGHRVYGYFPISTSLTVSPVKISERGFLDGTPHRQSMSALYNQYSYTHQDPTYIEAYEDEQLLFRPLYMTGWLVCDAIVSSEHVIDQVIVSSASSKTAIATAHALRSRGVSVTGITSARNQDFVESTGLFTQVLTYNSISSLPVHGKLAYVDYSGDPALTQSIHSHCGEALKKSLFIGATNWEADRANTEPLPGPKAELFFAPQYVVDRSRSLPAGQLMRDMTADIRAFYPISQKIVTATYIEGAENIDTAWIETADGKTKPQQGLICSL